MALLLVTWMACLPKMAEVDPTAGGPASTHAVSAAAPELTDAWDGVWMGEDSMAAYRFSVSDRQVWMDAWDSSDGEWFVLDNLRVVGGTVHVRTTMPSTQWTLENEFVLTKPGQMRNRFSGRASGDSVLRLTHGVVPPKE